MLENPAYRDVLSDGKSRPDRPLLLDLGCCMGTDLRKLVQDGYPSEQLLGCDLRSSYITLGYELYRDAADNKIHFFSSDVFSVPTTSAQARSTTTTDVTKVEELADLCGKLTYIYTGALFHLFDESTQKAIALRLAYLLDPESPRAVIFGRHQGAVKEGLIDDHLGRVRYAHSPLSWTKMWTEVFEEVRRRFRAKESRVEVQARLETGLSGIPLSNFQQLVWSVHVG